MYPPASTQPSGINGQLLYGWLGTFWKRFFKDHAILRAHYQSFGLGVDQAYLDYLEWVAVCNPATVPVFHRELWRPLTLRSSEMTEGAPLVYSETGAYFGPQPPGSAAPAGIELKYGGGDRSSASYSYPISRQEFVDIAGAIYDSPLDASMTLIPGRDFVLSGDRIFFLKDPMQNSAVAKRQVLDAVGDVVEGETEALLWVSNALVDLDDIRLAFGQAFQVVMESSTFYRDAIAQLFNLCRQGPVWSALEGFLAAMGGIPAVKTEGEVVEAILTHPDTLEKQVVTDKNVYTYPAGSTVLVEVGNTVGLGQILTDAIELIDSSKRGRWWADRELLALGSEVMNNADFTGDLIVKNSPEKLVVTETDGVYRAEFKLYGNPDDVALFWEKVRAAEDASGTYLADILGATPTTTKLLNPMDFLFENLFSNNSCILHIRSSGLYSPLNFDKFFGWFKQLIPAHVHFFVFYDLEIDTEVYVVGDESSENVARASCPNVVESEVEAYSGTNTELTYREGNLIVRTIPHCS